MRRWQKDEIFLFKLKSSVKGKSMSRSNIHDNSKIKYQNSLANKSPLSMSENCLAKSSSGEQPVKRMAKLAGFFGVVNSKQEEKNNKEKEEEVKGLFNMLHVMSNSKEEATNQIIKFIHSKVQNKYLMIKNKTIKIFIYKKNNNTNIKYCFILHIKKFLFYN